MVNQIQYVLKWDLRFHLEEETITIVAWILFPALPLNILGEEVIFPLVVAIGKPLQVNVATKNQTRPSCAQVKVEVNLLHEFPTGIKICVKNGVDSVLERWVRIKYNYVPMYCKTCMIQGHDEDQCYIKHLELFKSKQSKDSKADKEEESRKKLEDKGDKVEQGEKPVKDTNGFVEQRRKRGGKK